jgi:hypothetical protein
MDLLVEATLPRVMAYAQQVLRDDVPKGPERTEWTWEDVERHGLEEEFGVVIQENGTAEGSEQVVRIAEMNIRFPFVVDQVEGKLRVERARMLDRTGFVEFVPEDFVEMSTETF